MIYDLSEVPKNHIVSKTVDICIVGGGTAGVYLAQNFLNDNLNVIVVEMGDLHSEDAKSAFTEPNYLKQKYMGSLLGRVSGLGGTSAKWGGQMIPLSDSDFSRINNDTNKQAWPIDFNELDEYYQRVEKSLNIEDPVNYSFANSKVSKLILDTKLAKFFSFRSSTWIPFKVRNFAKAYKKKLSQSQIVNVWLNCSLKSTTGFTWLDSTLTKATFDGKHGQKLVISSRVFVITMGALESTKCILGLVDSFGNKRKNNQPFCDHISAAVGKVVLKDTTDFLSYFSPFFVKGVMKSLRFELSSNSQLELNVPSAFVHFVSSHRPGSALGLIRTLARKFQGEPIKLTITDFNPITVIKDLVLILWWRVAKNKLILNHGGAVQVVVDIEQLPNLRNRVSLDESNLQLSWSVGSEDIETVIKTAKCFASAWNSSPELRSIGDIDLYTECEITASNFYDVYHPTGSLAFGGDPEHSVIDNNLRVWDTSNLYVLSTAIFPIAGSANPGFTHLALTERLADHLKETLQHTKL